MEPYCALCLAVIISTATKKGRTWLGLNSLEAGVALTADFRNLGSYLYGASQQCNGDLSRYRSSRSDQNLKFNLKGCLSSLTNFNVTPDFVLLVSVSEQRVTFFYKSLWKLLCNIC